MTDQEKTPALAEGTRVRVVAGKTLTSRIHAGKTGMVVPRSEGLTAAEDAAYRRAFPVSVQMDGEKHPFVWAVDELEVIDHG